MRTPLTKYVEPYTLYELMSGLQADDLKLTYVNDDNDTITFCTDAIAKDVFERFQDRMVMVASSVELTAAEKRTQFLALYNSWWTRRKEQFGKLMDALTKDYDPIENYDRREEGGWSDTHDIGARSGTDDLTDHYDATKRTTTDEPGTTTTTTDTPRVVTESATGVYGDNSDTEVPKEVTTVTPTDGTNVSETVLSGESTLTVEDDEREDTHNRSTSSEAATDTDTREYDGYRVHGNIGVTTSAQMIRGEIELRGEYDLITHAIVEFVDLVSVYV